MYIDDGQIDDLGRCDRDVFDLVKLLGSLFVPSDLRSSVVRDRDALVQ